jgi:hypothetical protein
MAVISLTYYSYLLNPLVVSWAFFSSENLKMQGVYLASLFLQGKPLTTARVLSWVGASSCTNVVMDRQPPIL